MSYKQKSAKRTPAVKRAWVAWLKSYGLKKFLDSFLANVEDAAGTCRYCKEQIFVGVLIGGGVADWSTEDGDFGCSENPENHYNYRGWWRRKEEGAWECAGHMPVKRGE